MDLRKKITILGVTQLVAVAGILLFLYAQEAKEKVRNQYVEKARAVVLTTESTREEMGKKWDQGISHCRGTARVGRRWRHREGARGRAGGDRVAGRDGPRRGRRL
jgi:hypothetical protein